MLGDCRSEVACAPQWEPTLRLQVVDAYQNRQAAGAVAPVVNAIAPVVPTLAAPVTAALAPTTPILPALPAVAIAQTPTVAAVSPPPPVTAALPPATPILPALPSVAIAQTPAVAAGSPPQQPVVRAAAGPEVAASHGALITWLPAGEPLKLPT
jgi:hypothetical protein